MSWLDPLFNGISTLWVGGVSQNRERGINFIAGSNVTITVADNPGQARTDITIASSGGGGGSLPTGTGIAIVTSGAWGTTLPIGAAFSLVRVNAGATAFETALLTDSDVATGAAVAVAKLAPGTNGQGLLTNSSGAVAWGAVVDTSVNGFRLSLATGTPITTNDLTGIGTLFCVPYRSGQIALYVSSVWTLVSSAEFNLSLTLTSGKNYDVFVYSNSGTATLVLSNPWTNDTTRVDALAQQDGVWVLGSDHSRRWVGTLRASGTNTCEDSYAKRFLWNAYHQQPRPMKNATETTDTWTYTTGSFRQANSNAANRLEYVTGDLAMRVSATVQGLSSSSGSSVTATAAAIGIDSTTVNSAQQFGSTTLSSGNAMLQRAEYRGWPGLGYHALNWLEYGAANVTMYGDAGVPNNYQTGISGEIFG